MHFVTGLPKGVYVGQTNVMHSATLATDQPSLNGFNLALHVGDDPQRVHTHRMTLLNELKHYGVYKLSWLAQTHSTICHRIENEVYFSPLNGDGLVTQQKGHALMMMTADCLPIVLGDELGSEVATLHAGWRGLASGMIEQTITSMHTKPSWAWLGACISQPCFEVGAEVKATFCERYAVEFAFQASDKAGKYLADLYAIARFILAQYGVLHVSGGDACTYSQSKDYFSYRRDAKTGRMATFAFLG
ncbi:peptidoglycan editing factor PgeF [Acinetobacter rathckeae]|uniref:peptidoglycan editing factor PgeF n=1 Tax=Acinetobacter rathckeae TaxID=2605272 RepID=UPI0018A27985|nr:peptidoglycan editing factor PgeF [Acinetobacter rathckeae]MBF7686865.1 peptidoglycan editing factor PgeF [Acinetobacter rathckeae]MBF7694731.1 peptidoglycan editing factor PgeF [Acinetobacter rathckeae]